MSTILEKYKNIIKKIIYKQFCFVLLKYIKYLLHIKTVKCVILIIKTIT